MKNLLSAALALGLVAATLPAFAQPAHAPKPEFPSIELSDAKSHGQRAVDLLGTRLAEVAAWYRKTPDEFRRLLLSDRRLKIDRRGRMFVEDELERPLPVTAAAGSTDGALDGTLAPLDQTFLLHSRAGAKRTIYLNFKGAVLTNTAWSGSSTLTALPYDLDGVPYSFSNTELERIQYIWQRVAEDFAPFDVDVTTEAPPADRLTRSGSADDVFGTTALVTSRTGVYSCSCGGVAYVGAYDDTSDYYKPALVFYDALGSGNEKYVAEAISHEVGHNVGLHHDGTSATGYYQGHGTGATGWAPIMGVGYYQSLVQWSKGEYSGANNREDDYAVMVANGLPVRADDHGNTIGAASPMTATAANGVTTLRAEGVIERPGDIDAFSFSANAGTATFSVAGAARSSNLDAQIELRDASGTVLASANPVDAIGASLSVALPAAGTYYVTVVGVGKGDPLTTGYTNYGSLGQYAISGSVQTTSGQPPTAAVSATPTRGTVPLTVNFSSAGSADPDGTITAYDWTFGDGSSATGPSPTHVYATAGSFTAQLRVTDNSGLTASKSVTIVVDPQVVAATTHVAAIGMSLRIRNSGSANAVASVTVRDGSGNVVPGATVSGTWSGIVSGNASASTSSAGVASLNSPRTTRTGTFTFTVTGISLSGYSYAPAANAVSSASITR